MKKLFLLLTVTTMVSCGNSESYENTSDSSSAREEPISADTFMTKEDSVWKEN